MVESPK